MNGDITRLHTAMVLPSVSTIGYQILPDVDFLVEAGSTFAGCGWNQAALK